MSTPTPEERADSLVSLAPLTPDGPLFVKLQATGADPVCFGPYENPDLARQHAEQVRRFLAVVIREARAEASGA